MIRVCSRINTDAKIENNTELNSRLSLGSSDKFFIEVVSDLKPEPTRLLSIAKLYKEF